MLQILYSSGGLFATKMGLKTPFEIRIVTKFSTFYGMYRHFPHKFTHFFCRDGRFALFDIFSEKAQHNFIKTRGRGSTVVYKTYKKQTFFPEDVPKLSHLQWFHRKLHLFFKIGSELRETESALTKIVLEICWIEAAI